MAEDIREDAEDTRAGGAPTPGPGDIVVIPTEGLDSKRIEEMRRALASVGFKGLIAGVDIPRSEESQDYNSYLSAEVADWQDRYGPRVDESFLEEVVDVEDAATLRPMLTETSIKRALQSAVGESPSTNISAAQVYYKLVRAIDRLRDSRSYLQDGTLFMGQRKRYSGCAWEQRYWAITPEALHGIAMEDGSVSGIRNVAQLRMQQVLNCISGSPIENSLSVSGWLGNERYVSVD